MRTRCWRLPVMALVGGSSLCRRMTWAACPLGHVPPSIPSADTSAVESTRAALGVRSRCGPTHDDLEDRAWIPDEPWRAARSAGRCPRSRRELALARAGGSDKVSFGVRPGHDRAASTTSGGASTTRMAPTTVPPTTLAPTTTTTIARASGGRCHRLPSSRARRSAIRDRRRTQLAAGRHDQCVAHGLLGSAQRPRRKKVMTQAAATASMMLILA